MKSGLKRVLAMLAAGMGLAALAAVWSGGSDPVTAQESSLVERGRYLVTVAGCADCHSPKVFTEHGPMPDTARFMAGHPADEPLPAVPTDALGPSQWGLVGSSGMTAFAGPWGVSFASNLTSDKKTGMGNWSEEQFIGAMRSGKHRGFGRPILPPMPWPNVAAMTDDDLKATLAYFKSLKPISNQVPGPIPPSGH